MLAGMNNHASQSELSDRKTSTPTGEKRKPDRLARRQAISLRTESPPEHEPSLPPWLPVGRRFDELPEAIRQAVPGVIAPAYRQFVLHAPDESQRNQDPSIEPRGTDDV
jgi:hypothetical protein